MFQKSSAWCAQVAFARSTSLVPRWCCFWLQLGPTSFRLFIKPRDPGVPRAKGYKGFGLAGQGMGLQVFPGSVTEVVQVSGGGGGVLFA